MKRSVRAPVLPRVVLPRVLACLLLGLLSSGCFRKHTIEPGTWLLTIQARRDEPGSAQFVPPPANVEVTLDWGEEKDSELVRVKIGIPPSEEDPDPGEYALEGTLSEGKVELEGQTKYWHVKTWGEAQNPKKMQGAMYARQRNADGYFSGIWRLTKVEPKA